MPHQQGYRGSYAVAESQTGHHAEYAYAVEVEHGL